MQRQHLAIDNGNGLKVPAEKIIDSLEDALMELLERNPLLANVRSQINRISCGPGETLPDGGTPTASNPQSSMEEGDADDELDAFESGLYLCRWPNGDVSIVKAHSKREAAVQLDEWAGAEPADRTQPSLPIKKGRCGTMTHDGIVRLMGMRPGESCS
ncbi:MAG: hypothetical protein H7Y20_16105 [Bryobacteraceae bacterium]|nr:hypothetical protein [Bryobacteraceae bacterium]